MTRKCLQYKQTCDSAQNRDQWSDDCLSAVAEHSKSNEMWLWVPDKSLQDIKTGVRSNLALMKSSYFYLHLIRALGAYLVVRIRRCGTRGSWSPCQSQTMAYRVENVHYTIAAFLKSYRRLYIVHMWGQLSSASQFGGRDELLTFRVSKKSDLRDGGGGAVTRH